MPDETMIAVFETDLEVEARIYEGLLREAGLSPRIKTSEDPILTNIMRQIALPSYQVVVPEAHAAQAQSIIATQRAMEERQLPPEEAEEEDSDETPTGKSRLLLVGRLLVWLILLTPILLYIVLFLLSRQR